MKKKYLLLVGLVLLVTSACKQQNQKLEKAFTPVDTVQTANNAKAILGKAEVPILCYHRIAVNPKGDYAVSPTAFSEHIKMLSDSGFNTVSPDQLYDYLVYNKALPAKPILITFDDSRLEHFEKAAPELEKYGFRGVFFIMTITYDKKNYMTKEQIAMLAKAGHTIGLHTWDHTMVTKYKTPEDWATQIVNPKTKLESITGKSVSYFAYPNGVYNHTSTVELKKQFKMSFTLFSKRDSINPLQTVRRMIVPEWTAAGVYKVLSKTFKH
jgi:peptidoglycan/xylan/chitin deacetylase (PgdA/CDA1 family)